MCSDHFLYGVTNMGDNTGDNQVFKVDLRNGAAMTEAPVSSHIYTTFRSLKYIFTCFHY